MSWFDTKSFASYAKTALKEAQKKIDQVLDIQEDSLESGGSEKESTGIAEKLSKDDVPGNEVPNLINDLRPIETEPLRRMEEQSELATHSTPVDILSGNIDAAPGRNRPSFAATSDFVETCDISESVELVTTTNDAFMSDSQTNLKDATTGSIVIVSSSRVYDLKDKEQGKANDQPFDTPEEGNITKSITNEHSYELQTIDSDSTQSFEDVQPPQVKSTNSHFSESSDSRLLAKDLKSESASTQNSNDEMETATSSDIEIISNPNGDTSSTASNTTRTSPLKPDKKIDVTSGDNMPSIFIRKGHCRELSEISILSLDSPSEDEVEKLMKRISELNALVEARELSLLQSERQNAELLETNTELQTLVSGGNLEPSEEYTKRLSALEKKFQNCIRERDSLRLEVRELHAKIPKYDIADALTESQSMVAELRREGEKLSKEILHQSNIIKKLRSKEKVSDNQLKTLKDQVTCTSDEVERLKKTLSAKEDVERTQIEAVHKMSSENQRLEKDNHNLRSKLDDVQEKLSALQKNFDVVKTELQQRSKQHTYLSRSAENAQATEREKLNVQAENQELQRQIQELREKMRLADQLAAKKEQKLREENRNLMDRLESAEFRAESSTQELCLTTTPLMRHLESLQQTLNQRTISWNKDEKLLLEKLEMCQTRLRVLEHVEETSKSEIDALKSRCQELEEQLRMAVMLEEKVRISLQLELNQKENEYNRQLSEMNHQLEEEKIKISALDDAREDMQLRLNDVANKYNASLECQMQRNQSTNSLTESPQSAADANIRTHSPAASASVNSLEDGLGGSIDWQQDDLDCISNSGRPTNIPGLGFHYTTQNTTNFEYLPSLLKQREGELAQCQWELSRLQAERNALQEEIMQLSTELEMLKEKTNSFELIEGNYMDLQTRYDALLQMYGEKVERCDELELDLMECKEAYKIQLQELLTKLKT